MSVTFYCPQAKREFLTVPCDYGMGEEWACREGWRCGYCEDGLMEKYRSEAPEANFANGNAEAVLRLLGYTKSEDFISGEVAASDLPMFRVKLVRLLNSKKHREPAVVESYELEGGHAGTQISREGNVISVQRMGCPAFIGGNTDEQTVRRLNQLLTLVLWAQEREYDIVWS